MIYEYSRMGLRHERDGASNEDHICRAENCTASVIALADGVSTCSMAGEGAETAAEAFTGLLRGKGGLLLEHEEENIAEIVTGHVLFELKAKAKKGPHDTADYSSTLSGVMHDRQKDMLLIYNLGDCMVITAQAGQCSIAAAPYDSTDGCCVTTTKNAASAASVKKMAAEGIDFAVICSDGAWREMIRGNRLKKEVTEMIASGRFGELGAYLEECGCEDDSSFVALRLEHGGLS